MPGAPQVVSVLRWWWCAVRTRCSCAPLLARGRCARSRVWQSRAASLFAVFPAPRWSSVSTRERHRHCGRRGHRATVVVGLPGIRLVHRVSRVRRVALGVPVGGVSWGGSGLSGSWFAGRPLCSARPVPGGWGWVRVMAPAKGHLHQRMNRCASVRPSAVQCLDLQGGAN